MTLSQFDRIVISFLQRIYMPLARVALFTVFFWFGILKLCAVSPANPMVASLLEHTFPFLTFSTFIIILGIWEMAIGISFLIPGLERLAIVLLVPHMITTAMPLIMLPAITWQAWFVPTLEGQYIIKNLLIIALAAGIAGRLQPLSKKAS